MTTADLEEEVRWLLTWNMQPTRIAQVLGMTSDALYKRFHRAGVTDLQRMFHYDDYKRQKTNEYRRKKKAAA